MPLVAGLTLAACHDAVTAAPDTTRISGPADVAAGGGYRLTISGVGSPAQVARVEADPAPTATAAAQAPVARGLTPRPSALEFQFAATGSYTHGTRGAADAYRYVYTIYRVRNATGAPLTNLALLATARTATHLGATAISSVELAGGVRAVATGAALARAMLPAGASVLSRSGQPTADRADVLQVFPEADVATLGLGGTYGPLAYGFTVIDTATGGRTIAPTAAGSYPGLIVFAFKLPLQATASEDVFTFTYNFYAVTDAETRLTQSLEETDAASAAAVTARAAAIGATAVHVPRGSALAAQPGARTFCSVRITWWQSDPAAFLGAACPDQLTGLTVAPATVGVAPGATRQLTPAVTLGAGGAGLPAVAYASANRAVATVSATGLVTGVAVGTTTVYVSPYASSSLLVAVPVNVGIASVRLDALTTAANTPVDVDNVSGTITPTIAIAPAGTRVTSLRLFFNAQSRLVCERTFSELTVDQVLTCPVDTAALDPATGLPRFGDGIWTLFVYLRGYASPSATTVTDLANTRVVLRLKNGHGL